MVEVEAVGAVVDPLADVVGHTAEVGSVAPQWEDTAEVMVAEVVACMVAAHVAEGTSKL